MHLLRSKPVVAALAVSTAVAIAACGSSSSSSSSSSAAGATSTAASSSAAATPSISASSFTNDFTSMAQLKSLAAAGKGKIAAILPDTTSSTRYVEFDQPDIKKALLAAGVPASDIIIQNAQKSDQTFLKIGRAHV